MWASRDGEKRKKSKPPKSWNRCDHHSEHQPARSCRAGHRRSMGKKKGGSGSQKRTSLVCVLAEAHFLSCLSRRTDASRLGYSAASVMSRRRIVCTAGGCRSTRVDWPSLGRRLKVFFSFLSRSYVSPPSPLLHLSALPGNLVPTNTSREISYLDTSHTNTPYTLTCPHTHGSAGPDISRSASISP